MSQHLCNNFNCAHLMAHAIMIYYYYCYSCIEIQLRDAQIASKMLFLDMSVRGSLQENSTSTSRLGKIILTSVDRHHPIQ